MPSAASKATVVILTPGFAADESDSTCIPALQSYVRELSRSCPEMRVAVISFQYPAPAKSYRWHGVEVYSAGGANRRGLLRRLTWRRVVAAYERIRPRFGPTIVHSFWLGECTLVGQRLVRRFGGRQVASIMGQDATASDAYVRQLAFKNLTLTCGSTFAARQFAAMTGGSVDHVIPIGLDVESCPTAPRPSDIDIIGVGSLTALKNYALFIEIVADLRREFPSLRAGIIGDGPERSHLERQLHDRGLDDCLQLYGERPRSEVLSYLARSRIFLHPSRYEGQGYVFLEALHAGLPVIAFDVGHRPESSLSVVCRDEAEMRQAVSGLLREPLARQPVPVDTIAETVAAFRRVYGV